MEKSLRHFFTILSNSHFFNKTNFEQYLFNNGLRSIIEEDTSFQQINQIVSGLEVELDQYISQLIYISRYQG